jgi:vacuole membrane protein 1
MNMKKLSLITDFNESYDVLKNKILQQSFVNKLISNRKFLKFITIFWFSLSWGCYPIEVINNYIGFILYWLGLGILSSIGLGTGLQTGVLFVFPEIISRFNNNKNNYLLDQGKMALFNTNATNLSSDEIYSLMYQTYFDCILFVIIWGIGTALGELPPYLLALTVDMKDKKATGKLFDMLGDNRDRVKGYIDSTVYYLKQYSFLTILGLSAWPNALFDMCGVASGLVNLPMLEFLVPTIIGKAFIKNPIQLAVVLYSYGFYGDSIMSRSETSYLYMTWMVFVISFTLFFIKGAIENVVNSD